MSVIARLVEASTSSSGVPARLEDPAAIRRLAVIVEHQREPDRRAAAS